MAKKEMVEVRDKERATSDGLFFLLIFSPAKLENAIPATRVDASEHVCEV